MSFRTASTQGTLAITLALIAAIPLFARVPANEAALPAPFRHTSGAADIEVADHSATQDDDSAVLLAARRLIIPIVGIAHSGLRDTFDERRGMGKHEAIDIAAPRGTPVVAVDDGRVAKLFKSIPGGLTIYQFDPEQKFAYYYAHLDGYAEGLKEGVSIQRGDVLGYVGTTGNAASDSPHLHFAIFRLGPERRWWKGTPMNPYAYLGDRY
jgi:murein DD-endopeptidase MepM/ murein hydrolase activator NlpD